MISLAQGLIVGSELKEDVQEALHHVPVRYKVIISALSRATADIVLGRAVWPNLTFIGGRL